MTINRKMLSELAIHEPAAFQELVAIAKAAKARVVATDIDPLAIQVAGDNARLNGVAAWVRTKVATNLAGRGFRMRTQYDLVVANILAGPLITLAPAIARQVARGGAVVLSGLVPSQRARIVAAYRGQGLALRRALVVDGWLSLIFDGMQGRQADHSRGVADRRSRSVGRPTTDSRDQNPPRSTYDRSRRVPASHRRVTECGR